MDLMTRPYQTTEADKSFIFKKADTDAEKWEVYRSRFNICRQNFPYILNFNNVYPAKDHFDDHSILFYTTVNNTIVASCRITPFFNGEWEISKNLPRRFKLDLNPSL